MTLPAYITSHKGDANRITFWAVEFAWPSVIRLTEAPYPLVVDAQTYTPAVLSIEGIQASETDTAAVSATVTIGSGEGGAWQALLASLSGEQRHPTVTIREAWVDPTGASAVVQDDRVILVGRLESAEWDSLEARLTIGPSSDATAVSLPSRDYGSGDCTYRLYKGPQCAYAGAETTCDRLYATCLARGNQANFGGLRYPAPESVTIVWERIDSAGNLHTETLTLTQREA